MTEEATTDTAASAATPASEEATRQTLVPEVPEEGSQDTNPQGAEYKIPDDYKGKPWAGKIKSEDDLWKQLDNAQSLIGKKSIIPDLEKATEAEIEEFYQQSRPKDKSAYKFDDTLPEAMHEPYADLLHSTGITAHQGNVLIKKFSEMQTAQMAELTDEAGFKKELETSFGADYERTAGESAKIISRHLSVSDKEMLEGMPNQYLGLIYRLTDDFKKSYGATEGNAALNPSEQPNPANRAEERAKILKEIQGLQRKPHTLEEKNELIARYNKLGAHS